MKCERDYSVNIYEVNPNGLKYISVTRMEDFNEEDQLILKSGNKVTVEPPTWFMSCETQEPVCWSKVQVIYSRKKLNG